MPPRTTNRGFRVWAMHSWTRSAVADIAENPQRWPVIQSDIRRRLIHRFPYALFYRVDHDEIVVLAIAHLHRRPVYWIGRA